MRITRLAAGVALSVIASVALAVAPAWAQQMYVCQTPMFWCSFGGPPNVPNSTPCWCRTFYGPVNGYSINPMSAPPMPQQPPQNAPAPPPQQNGGSTNNTGDCLNGLGNCGGQFRQ